MIKEFKWDGNNRETYQMKKYCLQNCFDWLIHSFTYDKIGHRNKAGSRNSKAVLHVWEICVKQ